MEFAIENAEELYWHFEKQFQSGKKWFTYEDELIKRPFQVDFFETSFSAEHYAHDNTSGWDFVYTASMSDGLFHLRNILGKKRANELRENVSNHLNGKIMNNQNLEYLQSSLKYFGFGEKLNESLEINIQEQKQAFQLNVVIPHWNNKMEYSLHFKKSDTSEMYFFNRYDARLKNEKPENDRTQSFYVNKGSGITAKEAFNLLEGRSVYKDLINKEGEKYSAWVKLDFENMDYKGNHLVKHFSEKYGYDLEKNLSSYPIKELNDPEQKKQLLNSLQKGNVQQVSMNHEGKDGKFYIEAIPQFKNINVYDSKMHLLNRQNLQSQKPGKVESVSQDSIKKPLQKKDLDEQPAKQKQARKRKLSI